MNTNESRKPRTRYITKENGGRYPIQLETLFNAFDSAELNARVLFTEKGTIRERYSGLNLSSIATCLIQNVGRFCEDYASDFLIDWKDVEMLTSPDGVRENDDIIIAFGIRRHGVDHTDFLLCRLMDTMQGKAFGGSYVSVEHNYRKVLAVRIRTGCFDCGDVSCEVKLADLTDQLYKLDQADLDFWEAEKKKREEENH